MTWVNTVPGNGKRSMNRCYHSIKLNCLARYLASILSAWARSATGPWDSPCQADEGAAGSLLVGVGPGVSRCNLGESTRQLRFRLIHVPDRPDYVPFADEDCGPSLNLRSDTNVLFCSNNGPSGTNLCDPAIRAASVGREPAIGLREVLLEYPCGLPAVAALLASCQVDFLRPGFRHGQRMAVSHLPLPFPHQGR